MIHPIHDGTRLCLRPSADQTASPSFQHSSGNHFFELTHVTGDGVQESQVHNLNINQESEYTPVGIGCQFLCYQNCETRKFFAQNMPKTID